jgi:hypothetical protein
MTLSWSIYIRKIYTQSKFFYIEFKIFRLHLTKPNKIYISETINFKTENTA